MGKGRDTGRLRMMLSITHNINSCGQQQEEAL
jgi:hypothetical protein